MIFKVSLVFVALVFFGQASADPVPFKDCGSSGSTVNSLSLSDCTKLPCVFQKNTNVSLSIEFTTKSSFNKVTNLVYGIIAGVKVPFPLPQADACSNGLSCPLVSGKTYSETLSLTVLPVYPSISLYVQFQLNDEQSNPIACVLFPAKIQ